MNKFIIGTIGALFASLVVSAASAQEATPAGMTYKLTPVKLTCYGALTSPAAIPGETPKSCDPKSHPEITASDLANLRGMASKLAAIRGDVKKAQAMADQAVLKAEAAQRNVDEVNAKVNGHTRSIANVERDVTGLKEKVAGLESGHQALSLEMQAVRQGEAVQDQKIDAQGQEIRELQKTVTTFSLRASWLGLSGLGGDKISVPAASGVLGIGLGPTSRLNLELGVNGTPFGASSLGLGFKAGFSHNLGGVDLSAAWASYALGMTQNNDASFAVSGLELGVAKQVGSFVFNLAVMPGGVDYSKKMNSACYAIGANGGIGYVF
jgi:hypothetical protein